MKTVSRVWWRRTFATQLSHSNIFILVAYRIFFNYQSIYLPITSQLLKKGEDCGVNWLVNLFNVCWEQGVVPREWQEACTCTVPFYKDKEKKID